MNCVLIICFCVHHFNFRCFFIFIQTRFRNPIWDKKIFGNKSPFSAPILHCENTGNELISKTSDVNHIEELMALVEIGFSGSEFDLKKSKDLMKMAMRRTSTPGKMSEVQYETRKWFEQGLKSLSKMFSDFLYRNGPEMISSSYRKQQSEKNAGFYKCSNIMNELKFYLDTSSLWLFNSIGYNSKLVMENKCYEEDDDYKCQIKTERKFMDRQKYMLNGLAGFLVEASYLLSGPEVALVFEKSCNKRNKVLSYDDW